MVAFLLDYSVAPNGLAGYEKEDKREGTYLGEQPAGVASPEDTDRVGGMNNVTATDRSKTDGYIRDHRTETKHWSGTGGTTDIVLVKLQIIL